MILGFFAAILVASIFIPECIVKKSTPSSACLRTTETKSSSFMERKSFRPRQASSYTGTVPSGTGQDDSIFLRSLSSDGPKERSINVSAPAETAASIFFISASTLEYPGERPRLALTFVVMPLPIAQGFEILCLLFFGTTMKPARMPLLISAGLLASSLATFFNMSCSTLIISSLP